MQYVQCDWKLPSFIGKLHTLSDCIYSFFANSCAVNPDKVLFARPEAPSLTYYETNSLVQRFASVLVSLGVQRQDRIAVQVEKSAEAVCLYLACLQVGGIYLPLNTAYTITEVEYFLADSKPTVFVCDPSVQHRDYHSISTVTKILTLGSDGDGSLCKNADKIAPLQNKVAVAPTDLAAILYTSGTTGRSKGAMLTHQNLTSNCQSLLDAWEFTSADHLIHALPIFHTHGLFVACNMVLASGASMDFLSRFDAEQIISLCKNATVLMGVPTFYSRLLASKNLTQDATRSIRLFVSGSAPLQVETHRDFKTRTGHVILERYGMTETCMITSNPYNGVRRSGTVGLALPQVKLRIVGFGSTTPVKPGEPGAIEVKGPNVFKGYWQMPEKTASEFRHDGYFITGDIGYVDEQGYLTIVGRDKDLIISGGYNIYPKEVEILIDEVSGVLESAVIGIPTTDLGEVVVAVVVPDGTTKLNSNHILNHIKLKLARYKQPRQIFLVDELPRNVMGKVMKNRLREIYTTMFETPINSEQTK